MDIWLIVPALFILVVVVSYFWIFRKKKNNLNPKQ
jgi:hypothetical protein